MGRAHEEVCEKDLLPKRKGTLRSMQWAEYYGYFFLCLDQWTQHVQTNNFFLSGNAREAPSALFLFRKMPRVRCKRPGGAISELFDGTPWGEFTLSFTVTG